MQPLPAWTEASSISPGCLIEYEDGTQAGVLQPPLRCHRPREQYRQDPENRSRSGEFGGKTAHRCPESLLGGWGDKPGVMSKTGKWAFEKKEDAENFIKAHQGRLASFDGAMNTAYDDMAETRR